MGIIVNGVDLSQCKDIKVNGITPSEIYVNDTLVWSCDDTGQNCDSGIEIWFTPGSYTWDKPEDCQNVRFEIFGGGGSGALVVSGGDNDLNCSAGGGYAGEHKTYTTLKDSYSITVGNGGEPRSYQDSGGDVGYDGESSSVESVTALGGQGGSYANEAKKVNYSGEGNNNDGSKDIVEDSVDIGEDATYDYIKQAFGGQGSSIGKGGDGVVSNSINGQKGEHSAGGGGIAVDEDEKNNVVSGGGGDGLVILYANSGQVKNQSQGRDTIKVSDLTDEQLLKYGIKRIK